MIGLISYAALLGLVIVGTLRKPALALAGVICVFGLKQWGQTSTAFFAQHRTTTNLAVGVLVIVGVVIQLWRGQCVLCRMTRVNQLVLGMYGYAFLTLAWTPNVDFVLGLWLGVGPYVLAIVVLMPLLIRDPQDARRGFEFAVLIGMAICALALLYGRWGHRGLVLYGAVYDEETNPLALASMAATVFTAAALSLQRHQSLLKRLVFMAAIPLALAVILKSGSRGQLIASAVAVAMTWPLAYKQRNLGSFFVWLGSVALIVVLGVWLAQVVEINAARWSGEQSAQDVGGRLGMALRLLEQAMSNPLTMIFGLGNSSSYHYIGFYPHNAFLETLAEEGLIGGSIYLSIAVAAVYSVRKLLQWAAVHGSPEDRSGIAVLTAVFLSELLLCLKQGSMISGVYFYLYAIMLSRVQEFAPLRPAAAVVREGTPPPGAVPLIYPNLLR